MAGLKRFRVLEERDINRETFVESWPEAGLMVADSPYDPAPSIRIVDGRIVELDGRAIGRIGLQGFLDRLHGLLGVERRRRRAPRCARR